VAGNGFNFGDGGNAIDAELFRPSGLAFDSAGNLIFVDAGSHRIREVTPNGKIFTLAQSDFIQPTTADNPLVYHTAFDPSGTAYFSNGNDIFKVLSGSVTLVYQGVHALGFVVDASGAIYLANRGNNTIDEITPDGHTTRFAGLDLTVDAATQTDGSPALCASIDHSESVVPAPDGALYLSGHHLRKIDASGAITSVIRSNGFLTHLQRDFQGNFYFIYGNLVQRYQPSDQTLVTVAGDGTDQFNGLEGPATATGFTPVDIALGGNSYLYILITGATPGVYENGERVLRVDLSTGILSFVAGGGTHTEDNIHARLAKLNGSGITVDRHGNFYVTDDYASPRSGRIRKVAPDTLTITTVAGGGSDIGDQGLATNAELHVPSLLTVDADGNLFFRDFSKDYRIRKVTPAGLISTLPVDTDRAQIMYDLNVDRSGNLLMTSADAVYRLNGVAGPGLFGGRVNPGPGDVNADGNVNVADAVTLQRIVVGLISPTPEQIEAGDLAPNPGTEGRPVGDGLLQVTDIVALLRQLVAGGQP
jgi:hypothetical protein